MGGGRLTSHDVSQGMQSVPNKVLQMGPNGNIHSKTSPTGPTEGTPKPEYLIALVTYLGIHW